MEFRQKVIDGVTAGNFTVVCNGITSEILPGLDDDSVGEIGEGPMGPHAAGNFQVDPLFIIVSHFKRCFFPDLGARGALHGFFLLYRGQQGRFDHFCSPAGWK